MSKKFLNIKPQEVTANGERVVRYRGGDGKMHEMLPKNAAIPVMREKVIPAGTEITLAEAHAIEGFDFNKCSNLKFNNKFDIYKEIEVNRDDNGMKYLHLYYSGIVIYYYKKWHIVRSIRN